MQFMNLYLIKEMFSNLLSVLCLAWPPQPTLQLILHQSWRTGPPPSSLYVYLKWWGHLELQNWERFEVWRWAFQKHIGFPWNWFQILTVLCHIIRLEILVSKIKGPGGKSLLLGFFFSFSEHIWRLLCIYSLRNHFWKKRLKEKFQLRKGGWEALGYKIFVVLWY